MLLKRLKTKITEAIEEAQRRRSENETNLEESEPPLSEVESILYRFSPEISLEKKLRKSIYDALQGDIVEQLMDRAGVESGDNIWRSMMEGHSLKVDKPLLNHLYELFEQVKQALGFEEPVDFYVSSDSNINAYSVALKNPEGMHYIVNVNSALLNLMTDKEVMFVLGHELGHLIDQDSRMQTLISFVYQDEENIPIGLQHKIRLWNQLCELIADRYGFIACGELDACISAFYKMMSGLDINKMEVRLDVLLEENRKHLDYFLSDKGMSFDTHPVNPIRVESINLYANSASERDLEKDMKSLISILMKVGSSDIDAPMAAFIASAGLLAAKTDGTVNEDEVDAILEALSAQQMFAKEYLRKIAHGDVIKTFNESVDKILSIEPGLRSAMFQYIIHMALADGKLTKKEMDFITDIGEKVFGYSQKESAVLMCQFLQKEFNPIAQEIC